MNVNSSQLKVPLVMFKREKEISRKLEFDGLYISVQPSDDDLGLVKYYCLIIHSSYSKII